MLNEIENKINFEEMKLENIEKREKELNDEIELIKSSNNIIYPSNEASDNINYVDDTQNQQDFSKKSSEKIPTPQNNQNLHNVDCGQSTESLGQGENSHPKIKGKLTLKVLGCKLKLSTRSFGKMSPYVVINFSDKEFRTPVCEKGHFRPMWENQEFVMNRTNEEEI